jgi:hypothetical protein
VDKLHLTVAPVQLRQNEPLQPGIAMRRLVASVWLMPLVGLPSPVRRCRKQAETELKPSQAAHQVVYPLRRLPMKIFKVFAPPRMPVPIFRNYAKL